jgi:hypothetical protein
VGLFGRRVGGRHALGAAVTSIPSGPVPVAVAPSAVSPSVAAVPSDSVPEPAPAAPASLLVDEITALLASGEAWAGPEVETSWSPPALGGRVQLGFRDGSSTALDPSSSHSQALEELAQSLTRRR